MVEDSTSGDISHAVSLFRARGASRQDRRAAVVELASILEERRSCLQANLLTKDESALREIANKFDLRHRNADQNADYGDEFLEWIFYWYLATIHLTDLLITRG